MEGRDGETCDTAAEGQESPCGSSRNGGRVATCGTWPSPDSAFIASGCRGRVADAGLANILPVFSPGARGNIGGASTPETATPGGFASL